eukprot:1871220-Lingulodinium_polyedra.AAC.1
MVSDDAAGCMALGKATKKRLGVRVNIRCLRQAGDNDAESEANAARNGERVRRCRPGIPLVRPGH